MTTTVAFPAPERGSLGSVVGANVRALMAARGVSQKQMESILGVTQSAVSKRLRGVTPFDTSDLEAIADAFGVDPADLLADERRQNEAVRTPVGARTADELPRRDSNLQPADCRPMQVIAAFRTRLGSRRPGYADHQPAHDRILHSVDGTEATQVSGYPTFDGACVDSDREVA
jgi:transcriptional regulator with XRE-family HTH domain